MRTQQWKPPDSVVNTTARVCSSGHLFYSHDPHLPLEANQLGFGTQSKTLKAKFILAESRCNSIKLTTFQCHPSFQTVPTLCKWGTSARKNKPIYYKMFKYQQGVVMLFPSLEMRLNRVTEVQNTLGPYSLPYKSRAWKFCCVFSLTLNFLAYRGYIPLPRRAIKTI